MSCSLPYLPPPPFLLFYMLIAEGTVSRQFKPFYRPLVHSFMTNLILMTSPLHKPRSPLTSWQSKAAAETFQLHLEALFTRISFSLLEHDKVSLALRHFPCLGPQHRVSNPSLSPGISAASHKEAEHRIPPLKEKITE